MARLKSAPPIPPPPVTLVAPMRPRNFRCDDETWEAAKARATADGTDVSDVIRYYLREYVTTRRS